MTAATIPDPTENANPADSSTTGSPLRPLSDRRQASSKPTGFARFAPTGIRNCPRELSRPSPIGCAGLDLQGGNFLSAIVERSPHPWPLLTTTFGQLTLYPLTLHREHPCVRAAGGRDLEYLTGSFRFAPCPDYQCIYKIVRVVIFTVREFQHSTR